MDPRRQFLFSLGSITAAAAAAPLVGASAGAGKTPRYVMLIDLRRCIGCEACTMACVYENRVPAAHWRTVVPVSEVRVGQDVAEVMLPLLCNHCDDPACVKRCPADATYKTADGTVQIDFDACVGCGRCVRDCPYGARFLDEASETAQKCTLCLHRLQAGLLPACVETCVGSARRIGNLNDPADAVARIVATEAVKVLMPEKGTRPQVYYLGLDELVAARSRITLPDPRRTSRESARS